MIHETVSAQDTDARIWQDPFGVVARALKQHPVDCPGDDIHCRSPIDQLNQAEADPPSEDSPLIIGVTISGSPYPEVEEARCRARYAVVSALDARDYVSEDPHHIGYFITQPCAAPETIPKIIPFEVFEFRRKEPNHAKILVLWLDEDMLARQPLKKLGVLLKMIEPSANAAAMQIVGPFSSDALRDLVIEAAPPSCAARAKHGEKGECFEARGVANITFFGYGATVPDGDLKGALRRNRLDIADNLSIPDFLQLKNVHLFRTIATDEVVAAAMAKELHLHHVSPGAEEIRSDPEHFCETLKSPPPGEQHIALISEWDTVYGRTFPQTMQNALELEAKGKCASDGARPWVHKFVYLRGLDGTLPQAEEDDGKKGGGSDAPSAPDKDLASGQTFARPSELPFGQGQYDYLRRLAAELKDTDANLKKNDQDGIKAIGVLGTDVFDKLLILRALKPQFPETVFFTTDFDAGFTMESELNWTRNLLIASSFGPELRDEIQRGIPPFRDSYETSAFLAAQLATDNALALAASGGPVANQTQMNAKQETGRSASQTAETTKDPSSTTIRQEQVSGWLNSPPLFEIERTGDVLSLPTDAIPAPPKDHEQGDEFEKMHRGTDGLWAH